MSDALQLQIPGLCSSIIQHQGGAIPADQKLLERQDLTTVAQWTLGEKPQLGERIEYQASWLDPFDGLENFTRRLRQIDLGGMEHRELALAVEFALIGYQLDNLNSRQRPSMGIGAGLEFLGGFRQRDVKTALSGAHALLEKMQRQRGLARAWIAVDEI